MVQGQANAVMQEMPNACSVSADEMKKGVEHMVVRRRLSPPGSRAWMRRPQVAGDDLADGCQGLSRASTDDEPWSTGSMEFSDSGCEVDSIDSTCDSLKDESTEPSGRSLLSSTADAQVVRRRLPANSSKAWIRRPHLVGDDLEEDVEGLVGASLSNLDQGFKTEAWQSMLISAELLVQPTVPSTKVCVAAMRTSALGVPEAAASMPQGFPVSPSPTFAPGTTVVLCNLAQQADFNSSFGTVTSFDEEHGSYNILLEKDMPGGHRTMKIKAEDLSGAVFETGPEIGGRSTLVLHRLVA